MKRKAKSVSLCRSILTGFLLVFISTQLSAQSVTNYGFTNLTGTFTALSGATAAVLATGNTDDGSFTTLPIGFDFWYMGTRYTTISASTNGWMTMGSTITDTYTNSLSAGGTRPVIAPLWDDLNVVSASNVNYKTTGTAGSRIFTVQYLSVKWNYQNLGAAISFQANFYESTGRVEFIYRPELSLANLPSASVGITGTATGSGNFLSVSNAGTTISSTTQANVTSKPISGKTYRFTPPVPNAPTILTFTGISGTSMTLNWVDNSSNEVGFVIYRSTDGINYSFVSQTAASGITSAQSGLTAGSTYYWKVYAVTEGGLSTALSGSMVAGCAPVISQLPTSNLIAYYKFEGNANDATGNDNGTLQGAPTPVADRFGNANKAYIFDGNSQFISTVNSYVNPSTFSTSVWFKTSTTVGGALLGFSSLQTGLGGGRDRFIYMTSTGILYAAVAPAAVKKYISSPLSYNDGKWHMASCTVGAGGLKLYVDGALVAVDATTTVGETTTGYWRLGYSDLSTWPNEPTSYYFSGALDDAIIYHRELTATEVGILYNSPDGAGSNSPVCAGSALNLTATTISGGTYSWTGPNSFTSVVQNPSLTYTAANAGVYTVQVTVAGCVTPSVAAVNVASTGTSGQWTGNVSTDWSAAANWCNGILPTSTTDVTITSTAIRMPSITTSVSCRNLSLNIGSTLTLGSAGTLNIAGTLANNGTFTNTGTVNFNGTGGQQTFSGIASFFNLTLNNSNGLLLPAAITVNNNLLLTAGTLNANNFNLIIKGNWTNNVSATAFTAGTATVTFNNTTAQVIAGTFSSTFNNLVIANTASTTTLNTNISISGNLSVNSGTFDLSTFTANRATAGGALMVANNATLKIGGTNTYPVNFTANTLVVASTVEYSGTAQTVANQLYGNLTLSSSGGAAVKTFPATALTVLGNLSSNLGAGTSVSYTAAAIITVNGNVSIGASTTFNGGSFSHNIGGNWVNSGAFNGNTGTVIFTGPGSTVSGSGTQNFNNLTIAASLVSFSAGSISLTGNLATTGSGSFSQLSGGTVLMTGTSKTISGTGISPDNLTISGTVSTTDALVITGNLSVSGSFTTSAGAITMSGTSKTISGAGTLNFGILSVTGSITSTANFTISSSLSVNGSLSATAGTATFTGTATLSGTANLFNTTINGTSLQLSASSTLGIASALTITAGILDVSSSAPNTVNFNGSGAQNINAITYNNLSLSNGNNKTAIAALTINNSLTIGTGTTFIPGAFTHSIYSNWNNSGTFTAGTSTIQFLGNQSSNITGATTFNILTINNTTAATGATLQNNITAATVNMTMGTLLTGTNTLTITGTRNGNGIILGNIRRNHAFNAGTAYAFEGPNNLITFVVPLSVNSVTMSVVTGPVVDFPFGGSISRIYTVTIPSGTYLGATLRLHYEDTELNGSNEATMGLWHYNGTSWASSGKTANDATANYVEQSLLLDITNRWTLSDNSNVVQWNGSVSTNWNTAANWTTVQGSVSTPPSATDIVNLGTMAFTNQPTISSAVNVKNINFGSAQAVTLSMAGGGSLTSGDIYGTWGSNVTHTINANNQSVTINGNLSLSDGTSGHAINLNIGTGTVTLGGSLTQSGGANVVFSGAGNLVISVNHNYVNGTFTPGTGTVTYSGTTNQVIGAVSYNNLTINKSAAAAEINNTLSIGGNLTVTAGELDNFSTTTVIGDVIISSGAKLHNTGILYVGGNWANSGTYDDAGTKTVFNGGGTQTITASTFNNLEINKPVSTIAVLTGDVTIKGNLTGTSGTLDIKSFFFNRTVIGGTAIIADAGTLIIAADNAPNKFANYALGPLSTVIFNGTGTQHLLLPGVVYGNLTFRDSGLKILYTPITVNSDLTIETGATFDGGSNTITLNGNWINGATYIPSASTVLFAGATKNITGNNTFNKATVTGSYTIVNDATFNTLLNITSTGALYGGSTLHITMNGDLVNSGTLYTLGSTTFTGNVVQTLSLINAVNTVALTVNFNGTVSPVLNSTSAPQFGFLNINNTGGVTPSVGWTILYSLTVGSGASFTGGNPTHNLLGALTNNGTITSSGTLNFIPSTTATINMGSVFSSTGNVVFGGAGAMTLAGSPTSFRNVVISNTNVAGITPSSAWTITNNITVNSAAILNAGNYSHLIAGNISNNGTLNGNTSTFTMNGTAVQNIYSISPFNNLTVSKTTGSVQLLSNVGINGTLNFTAGIIQTGSNVLTQSSTGNITGAAQNTGWINGRLQKNIATGATTKTFEIGDTTSYTPVSLTFASVTTAGDLIASTTAGDHPEISSSTINQSKSINRYWSFINSGIAFNNYAAIFNFKAADVDAGASTSAFGVGVYSGTSWTMPTITVRNATNTTATGLTFFGDYAIGEVCNAGTGISYAGSPYCSNAGTVSVTLTGTTGGTFTSMTGLSIDGATGNINLAASIAGTYTVTYTIAASGTCSIYTATALITVTKAPLATVSYIGTPFYSGSGTASVTFSGTLGGTYSSTTGLTINAITGDVTLATSTLGSYTVTYTVAAAGGCSIYTTTTSITVSQAPNLGTMANFVLFSSNGAIGNTGISQVTGDVGTNIGAITAFGNVNGVMHTADAATALGVTDLQNAYNQLNAAVPTAFPAAVLGNGATLTKGVYSIPAAGSLNLALNLDAQGDPNAVFIFKIGGAFSTAAASQVNLINGAQACNVFWKVEGLASMAAGTIMRGTIIANNAAISLGAGVLLEGRALSTAGAVTVNGVLAYTPIGCGSPYLTGPSLPLLASTACYTIFSSSGSVTNTGTTMVRGDIGTNVGITSGFNALNVAGTIHTVPDASTGTAASDLLNVYGYLNSLTYDIELLYPAQLGNKLVLTPHTYLLNAPTTFADSLYLDAQGNANAVFVLMVNGSLTVSANAAVKLLNGAQAKNVFWKIEGNAIIGSSSNFKGTILCNNASITLNSGAILDGRALTTSGTINTNTITIPGVSAPTISYAGSPYCPTGGTGTVTMIGTTGGTFSSTTGLSINAATGDITLATSAVGTYTVSYTDPSTGDCSLNTATTSVTILQIGTWTGTVSTDWSIAGNWVCNSLPISTTNVILPGSITNYPVISAGTNPINNITVQTGASLTVSGASLQIAGTITNNGTFTVSSGTIEINGSSAQTIPSSAFAGNLVQNLTISNSAGVTLGGTLSLTGILLVSNGQLNAGGYLTLLSSATQTALIDGTGAGGVLGNITMQRYLIAGYGYKYFSSPFQGATVSNFASTVDLNAAFPNFYNYIENKSTSGFTTYTTTTNTLNPLEGYAADFGSSTAQKTVSIVGVVSNGALSTTLYNHNQPYTKGFNLIGNPYPSPINWDASAGWARTNIDNAVYFFNSGSVSQYTGGYSTYVNGISSDGIAAPVIASMQGFFVHVSDGAYPVTATLAMNNSVRINDLAPVFHKSIMSTAINVNSNPRMLLRLSANFSDQAQSSDPIVIYTSGQATRGFDRRLEAIKLMNDNGDLPNLYALAESSSKLVINALSELDTTTVIPLGIKIEKDGNITFNLRKLENWPANLSLYLADAVTGTNQDLQRTPLYTVNLKKGTIENRFSLRCVAVNGANETNGDVYILYGSGGTMYVKIGLLTEQRGQLIISNIAGQVISRREIEGNGSYPLIGLVPDVVYLVSFITPRGTHTKKILINSR